LRFRVASVGGAPELQVLATGNGFGTYQSGALSNDGSTPHTVEVRLVEESSGGVGDAEGYVYLDGVLVYSETALTSWSFIGFTANPSNFLLSSLPSTGGGPSGAVVVDDIIFRDDDTQIFPPPTPGSGMTAAPLRRPCAIDADGSAIYIAALNASGFPILIQFDTSLTSDGVTVFDPGAGADIGVACSRTNSEVIWVAGEFDGTNTVERSDDGGNSFGVVDPGTFAPVTAFRVGPDSDERCLAALLVSGTVDTVEIHETTDAGASWQEKASGITSPLQILALDRLDINLSEVVFGCEDNTADRSDYSPNAGVDLDDITTGTPAADTTGVSVGWAVSRPTALSSNPSRATPTGAAGKPPAILPMSKRQRFTSGGPLSTICQKAAGFGRRFRASA
jgi:hypothetical protein